MLGWIILFTFFSFLSAAFAAGTQLPAFGFFSCVLFGVLSVVSLASVAFRRKV